MSFCALRAAQSAGRRILRVWLRGASSQIPLTPAGDQGAAAADAAPHEGRDATRWMVHEVTRVEPPTANNDPFAYWYQRNPGRPSRMAPTRPGSDQP